MIRTTLVSLAFVLAASTVSRAETPCSAPDPELMNGFPPPQDKRVTRDNFMTAPYNRWAFRNIRELQPTRRIEKGAAEATALQSTPLPLGAEHFEVSKGRELTLDEWMGESCTDAMVVLHEGSVVFERYMNGMRPDTRHQMFSVTKSFVGTLALLLIHEDKLDPARTISSYLPEMKDSAFGDATVQQVLNMTTSIEFSEAYTDPASDISRYGYAFGIGTPAPDYSGPMTIYGFLPTLKKATGPHGQAFHYVTPNTDVLAWILSRVTGKSLTALMQERLWQYLGVEHGGYFWLGRGATEMAGGGLNITARDAARFGQMILQEGRFNDQQILPASVAKRILASGDPAPFNRFYQDPWFEEIAYAYHDQWWTFNNSHKAVSAIGVYGQFIYIDPVAKMVLVKQSSHPLPESAANEVDGPLLWHQLATRLKQGVYED